METLTGQTRRYLLWMRSLNYSPRTIEARTGYLKKLNDWFEERAITDPKEVKESTLESYRRHVGRQLRKDGKPLSFRTQRNRLVPVKSFFKWLRKVKAIPTNPAADLDMPRQEKRLPRMILSETETSTVLDCPDVSTASGLRDRAMMETLYSTGIRRAELAALDIRDVDAGRGLVSVKGKGGKDRMVAISENAIDWIARYLEDSRPELATPASPQQLLFLNDKGEPWRLEYLSALVKKHILASGVEKPGGCHLLRHACATHMLDNGADIRHVQEQLGHASLQTTQVYTHVSLMKLKEAHAKTHPSARSKPQQ
jgi:integrase/recombinase XerD